MLGLLDFANEWIKTGGIIALAVIIFAETGLLVLLPDRLERAGGILGHEQLHGVRADVDRGAALVDVWIHPDP